MFFVLLFLFFQVCSHATKHRCIEPDVFHIELRAEAPVSERAEDTDKMLGEWAARLGMHAAFDNPASLAQAAKRRRR
jgi:hypothetical protein